MINTKAISRTVAENEGFLLASDAAIPYGVLTYDDFNIFHICIAAGLNPFVSLDDEQRRKFSTVAGAWFDGAAIVSDDHHTLNRALVEQRIAMYLSGGVYTASISFACSLIGL